ncbi:4-hydroxy-tetrahydrodipicolinate synthase [Seminavis robusta]|uniref:4-hydroxy-tetrahydrodipicolinate synthase n=1 Tax=Seminavis robusta TaxID=568900 RepID=A0A9N8EA93_9STRA|nr:4-hydroxy-tetrahydrodipicolinate synthase [Seminavis robusta]|eukprot:Sro680_g186300.1 4-hydroxy-tetrahydrodipicolinate synthase (367) ;mRNA; r:45899-47203
MKLSLCILLPVSIALVGGFVPRPNAARAKVSLNAGTNADVMMPLRKGSTCALITPFTEWGRIDIPNLEKLIQWHLDGGTDNLCILGTTAEAAVMDMEDRAVVLNTVVKHCKGRIPLLVGTGTINPESVKEMTQQAIDMGADANLLVTPYYVKPPMRGIIKHFTKVANMGLPVIMYNVPGRTACSMTDETIATLAGHENIVGIKDATGDLSRLHSVKAAIRAEGLDADKFLSYSGDDGTTKDFLLQGGDGCISVTANIVPHMMTEMVWAALDGDVKEANTLNDRLADLHKALFVESNPIACKWAAKRIGLIDSDYCKPPLDAMEERFEPVVDAALKSAGFLGVSHLHHKVTTHDDTTLPMHERVPFL